MSLFPHQVCRRSFLQSGGVSLGSMALTDLLRSSAVQALDRNEGWSWIAAVLVSPLSMALAVGTALFWWGRTHPRRRPSHDA